MTDLSMGLKMILGMNGWIWLEPIEKENSECFEMIAKLRNILEIYDDAFIAVRMNGLLGAYNLVSEDSACDLFGGEVRAKIYEYLAKIVNDISKDNITEILAGMR